MNARTVSVPTRVEITTEDVVRQLREAWLSSIGLPPNAFVKVVDNGFDCAWVVNEYPNGFRFIRVVTAEEGRSEVSFGEILKYARSIDFGCAGGVSRTTPSNYLSNVDPGDSHGG